MKKILLIIIFCIVVITGCNSKEEKKNIDNIKKVEDSVKIIIDNKEYTITLQDNKTVNEFINMLPLEIEMNDLNNNEKYTYLDKELSTNSNNPKHINKGDVMLFGNNCLVIFYESFDTSYSYTKIGHIDNLPDLGSGKIKVRIEK